MYLLVAKYLQDQKQLLNEDETRKKWLFKTPDQVDSDFKAHRARRYDAYIPATPQDPPHVAKKKLFVF